MQDLRDATLADEKNSTWYSPAIYWWPEHGDVMTNHKQTICIGLYSSNITLWPGPCLNCISFNERGTWSPFKMPKSCSFSFDHSHQSWLFLSSRVDSYNNTKVIEAIVCYVDRKATSLTFQITRSSWTCLQKWRTYRQPKQTLCCRTIWAVRRHGGACWTMSE